MRVMVLKSYCERLERLVNEMSVEDVVTLPRAAAVIEPIDAAERDRVVEVTRGWVMRAGGIWQRRFDMLPVLFDLRGRAAGMYRVRGGSRVIRYNPWLFAKYPEDNLRITIPHEVAHYVTDCLHGLRGLRPHGVEWRAVMQAFGVDPRSGVAHDLSGIPLRAQRRHAYRCGCGLHELSTRRHRRVQREGIYYLCRRCGDRLVQARP